MNQVQYYDIPNKSALTMAAQDMWDRGVITTTELHAKYDELDQREASITNQMNCPYWDTRPTMDEVQLVSLAWHITEQWVFDDDIPF